LDILAPGQPVTHIHGTWIGFTEDEAKHLRIELSAPWGPHEAGQEIHVSPLVQLWRPHSRRFVYRPRTAPVELAEYHLDWLARHPEWDTDSVVVQGPWRHQ
jgi:hypothetical protein